MRHLAPAALLASAALFAAPTVASANPGPCTYGYGCGGYCLNLFAKIHQHGPLYNYGPYYGYPPFEPYGYWNPYLQYTGPTYGHGYGGGTGWIWGGHGGGGHGSGHGGCSHCGGKHAHTHGHTGGGCSSCGAAAAAHVTSGPALARYSGYGDPSASAAYYAGNPSLVPTDIVPVGAFGR